MICTLFEDSNDGWNPSIFDEAPAGSDKWINPAIKLPEPAPNLEYMIVPPVLVDGETIEAPRSKSEHLEVLPPAPNIHSKTCIGQPPTELWGDTHTPFFNAFINGEPSFELHSGKNTKSRLLIPWKDVNFHGSHVRWKNGLDITKLTHVADWNWNSSIHQDIHTMQRLMHTIKQADDTAPDASKVLCRAACQGESPFNILESKIGISLSCLDGTMDGDKDSDGDGTWQNPERGRSL